MQRQMNGARVLGSQTAGGCARGAGTRELLQLLLAGCWIAGCWRPSLLLVGHHTTHANAGSRLGCLTCLFVVKPNACRPCPNHRPVSDPVRGPALESLQHQAWRAAHRARGLAGADAALLDSANQLRSAEPTGRVPRLRREKSESSRCWLLRCGAWGPGSR